MGSTRSNFMRAARSRCRTSAAILLTAAMALGGAVVADTTWAYTYPVTATNELEAINKALANRDKGGFQQPSQGTIGGENNDPTDDQGVATWVGRNMYVGAPKGSETSYGKDSYINETYAVEAEGLTLVNGKLAMNMVKGKYRDIQPADNIKFDRSWHRNGFRFGVVGFGGQVRPAQKATVLSIGNNVTGNPLTLTDENGNNVNALGFGETGRGFADAKERYWIDVAGPKSTAIGDYTFYNGVQDSLYILDLEYDNDGFATGNKAPYSVNWDAQNKLGTTNIFEKVNYTDNGTEKSHDFSKFQTTVDDMSTQVSGLSNTGTTTVGVAPSTIGEDGTNTPYVRQKYDYYAKPNGLGVGSDKVTEGDQTWGTVSEYHIGKNQYQLELTFNDAYKEKLVTFQGDGTSKTQVFTLNATDLSCGNDYNGVSFAFNGIPDGAAVVVNVIGEVPSDFHAGWRFWWNGTDISNGYVTPPSGAGGTHDQPNADGYYTNEDGDVFQGDWDWVMGKAEIDRMTELNQLYSRASEAIMWNFKDATNLKIHGGKVSEGQAVWQAPKWSIGYRYSHATNSKGTYYYYDGTHKYGTEQSDPMQVHVDDDPAAAMLGSIMVPKGTFESHVTTNGRVWVGEDFMMFNPDGLERYAVPTWNATENKHGEGTWNYEDISASLVCMDQERHNFIWSADYTESAAALQWNKTNESGERIGGTQWSVYTSFDDAKNNTDALIEMTDNGANDMDPAVGVLKTTGLVRNANYYIRETAAPGYEVNPRIYQINTGNTATADQIIAVFDGNGELITDSNNFGLVNVAGTDPAVQAIANRKLPSVEWEKVDAEDASTRLPDSEWKLQYTPTTPADALTETITPDITDSISTRIYFNPSKVKWGADGATYYVKYNTKQKDADGNDIWEEVQLGENGLTAPTDGMLAASIPMSGQSFDFYFLYKVDGTEEGRYYKDNDSDPKVSFTAPANTGHYYVIDRQEQQTDVPACAYEEASMTDSDPRPGYFKIIGLDTADYLLTETQAPSGYWSPDSNSTVHYGFTVEGHSVTWANTEFTERTKGSDGTVTERQIPRSLPSNMPWPPYTGSGQLANTPSQVSWWKVDADDKDAKGNVQNTLLTGSAWELQQWTQTPSATYEYTTMKYNIVDATSTLVYVDLTDMGDSLEYEMNGATHRVSALQDTGCGSIKVFEVPSAGSGFTVYPYSSPRNVTVSPGATVVFIQHGRGNGLVSHFYPPTCAVSSAPQDEDSTPGKFSLKRLPVGKYRIKETKAPLGYILPSDEYIYFEVKGTKSETENVEWKQGWAEVDSNGSPKTLSEGKAPIAINKVSADDPARIIGNDRKPGEAIWEKVESGTKNEPTPTLLSGSEWSLAYTKYGATESDTKPTKTLTIKDCVEETKDSTTTKTYCTVAENGLSGDDATTYKWAVDVDTTGGKFKISDMPWGSYVLTETKAPDGYNLDTMPHRFSIGVKEMNGNTVVGSNGDQGIANSESPIIQINLGQIENEPGVILPATGGEGRQLWPAALGLLCVVVAMGCALQLRRRS